MKEGVCSCLGDWLNDLWWKMRERGLRAMFQMESLADCGGFLEGNLSAIGQEKQRTGKEKLRVGFVDFVVGKTPMVLFRRSRKIAAPYND